MRIVLLSCYELGHAPHGLALPLAFLRRAGFSPLAQDLAHEALDEAAVAAADLIAVSVPMHTALRLGARLAGRIRALNPHCHLCYFGLYAPLNREHLLSLGVDSVLAGECEPALVELAQGRRPTAEIHLARLDFPPPAPRSLAGHGYARLQVGDTDRLAGYTESSRGCLHLCRHCPIPAVYGGRFFVVPLAATLADIDAQVADGARHITFGDADFFNGPRHSMALVRELHRRHPQVTFDATIKVSHLLRHRDLAGELPELGCAFAVSAVESLNDRVLAALAKGHTRADVERVFDFAREVGLTIRPTFVPFTPWTGIDDLLELANFIADRDLIDCVDPVQLTIRLLVPPGSLLLTGEDADAFGALDTEALTHAWRSPDPLVDRLQLELAARAEAGGDFYALAAAIYRAADREPPQRAPGPPRAPAPRLTESWFC